MTNGVCFFVADLPELDEIHRVVLNLGHPEYVVLDYIAALMDKGGRLQSTIPSPGDVLALLGQDLSEYDRNIYRSISMQIGDAVYDGHIATYSRMGECSLMISYRKEV